MRNLEAIERDLTAAREALSSVEGTPAEVYSRIVGYYRSVRNWNRGKREEYGERRLYSIIKPRAVSSPSSEKGESENRDSFLLLFVRSSCPGCPPAKAAAGKLGIPVEYINADTAEGMTEAIKRNVMSTPTAILLSAGGKELARSGNVETIGKLLNAPPVDPAKRLA